MVGWLELLSKKRSKEEGKERTILYKFEDTIMDDKIVQQHNIVESIKKTMLMHDEIAEKDTNKAKTFKKKN